MFSPQQYELLDFGSQQKLERWAGCLVSRATPSAAGRKQQPERWSEVSLRFQDADQRRWTGDTPEPWIIDFALNQMKMRFELRPTPSGQIGIFPEQSINWEWLFDLGVDLTGCKALNLFAYTGGTSLALARLGASVTHVDAAASVVKWARRNASLSELTDHPIRWIVEDAERFIQREINRGNKYDILIADPPSFGRGPKGQIWKFQRDIDRLVEFLSQIASDHLRLIIFSSHTPGFDHYDWSRLADRYFDNLTVGNRESLPLQLKSTAGRTLDSGHVFRWCF